MADFLNIKMKLSILLFTIAATSSISAMPGRFSFLRGSAGRSQGSITNVRRPSGFDGSAGAPAARRSSFMGEMGKSLAMNVAGTAASMVRIIS